MKKIIYPVLALLLMTSAGCEDKFFDINQNPNAPTEESITSELLLPGVLHASAAKMAISYDFAAHWLGRWARSGTYGQSLPLENYDITTTYQQDEWSGWYDILKDADLMEKKATESGEAFYAGTAKVVKSIGFMYLVDQYNNVPYSEAFDIEGHILPSYDKGEDIYDSLLVELDEAAALFASAEVTPAMETADVVFGGDTEMWRKLVNTQRLKLLLRQSEVSGFDPSATLAKIEADGSGFLESGETAWVSLAYAQNENKQNPYWNAYKETFSGGSADDFNRANNYVLNKFVNNDDIRYQYFFSEARTPVNGKLYVGYDFGLVSTDPNEPKAANSSDVAGPGLVQSATDPQWLFTSVESMFLQAEATQRGWLTGNAEEAYNDAVRESFMWLGVEDAVATADEYLEQDKPIVNWSAASDKIELIVMQKYLALVGINNFEAWADYRRLGVPGDVPLSLSESRNGKEIPKRLMYPQTEYNYNAANVKNEGAINPQTSTVFWDVE
ncbi:SusD/RagB family nutrient-binding outer membrane lipoprotein [Pontibacter mangrovi]|uniref:SusD/RagB family nutrient-binding outer membrane lipoprotein n=1 Tax=Pontibacter mangrovi TaxID=2589816 RepID=A0A501W826_9BACT|nr:SusD/RagB family nutrient-binding outer membrane lipoprotein [Pontibacter mangrovi]TPE44882.1 SusD/RagB family nutrient-binding outer membrane lipoprotein [Pontibacter mangrovi]